MTKNQPVLTQRPPKPKGKHIIWNGKAWVKEFDLDDDDPQPEPWANDMRVKRGIVR